MSALSRKLVIIMQGPNEIRRHIAGVEQTKKITGAMEMVSSNRMRQVMGHIEQNHLYFGYTRQTMKDLLRASGDVSHPYLSIRPRGHVTFMVISGDKGLCGAHNVSVLNFAKQRMSTFPGAALITVGHTAYDFFNSQSMVPDITLLGLAQDPTLERAREVAMELTDMYENELTDDIRIVFTSFYGPTKGKPVEFRLLPAILHDYEDVADAGDVREITYHPSAQTVLDMLIPQYIIGIVFGVLVQAYASEHYARMNAMHSATTNAKDILENLNLQYNLARQSAITTEIAEITGAAEVLKGETGYDWQ